MNCPGCQSTAAEQAFDKLHGGQVLLDVCHACHGVWFDAQESPQLSAAGVLQLFREMHGKRSARTQLLHAMKCPRCREVLSRTHDMVRDNRFQYFRCPSAHGRFITFFQFLREKGIVRNLSARQLTELKKHAQLLQCSDCGGSISLAKDTACPACHAPLCILDPKAVGITLDDAKKAAAVTGAVLAPAVAAQLLMDQLGMEGVFRTLDGQARQVSRTLGNPPPQATPSEGSNGVDIVEAVSDGVDLIDLGIDAFFSVFGGIGDLF
ncbi:Transcription factor zinc-finger [Stigmatella aurantiaca]|uniref:Transcription factor zinc-finger n=1 Tax=Stigmatella aurantiaca TaxID=41 RepID=A0A1H7JRU8_STIAU|nr:zf-TFIIB domain-containing protein [Stigmatella aurantiaca]SEK77418.1 Transcription factor zinc-finger [Stigmatella aurantiaca]